MTMKPIIILSIIVAAILMVLIPFSCERIDAGHVGVKVDLYGKDRGVNDVVEVTGTVFYNPFTENIYEFPVFMQHKEYVDDESFVVNSKDGSEFSVSPIINYYVMADSVPYIFKKYRKQLKSIESGFLKTAIYEGFRVISNSYSADDLIGNREKFETEVKSHIMSQLGSEGFILDQFTSNLEYPSSFKDAIEAKNNAVQNAITVENQVRKAEAQAKIAAANAKGTADSLLTMAKAEAEANRMRLQTLTPLILQQQWIEKWDGVLPVYGQVPQLTKLIGSQ